MSRRTGHHSPSTRGRGRADRPFDVYADGEVVTRFRHRTVRSQARYG